MKADLVSFHTHSSLWPLCSRHVTWTDRWHSCDEPLGELWQPTVPAHCRSSPAVIKRMQAARGTTPSAPAYPLATSQRRAAALHDRRQDDCCVRCRSVDVTGFWKLMHEALDATDAASPLNEHGAAPLLTAAVL